MADPQAPTIVNRPPFPSKTVELAATALVEAPGTERYEKLKLIGEGGMGEIHLCRDARIGREVARKVMRPEAAAYPDGRERFLREARVQGQLEHPAVVPVYELGEED